MGRTALELIGKGGFGHSFDPLVRSEPDPYAEAVKQFVYVRSSTHTPFIPHLTRHLSSVQPNIRSCFLCTRPRASLRAPPKAW